MSKSLDTSADRNPVWGLSAGSCLIRRTQEERPLRHRPPVTDLPPLATATDASAERLETRRSGSFLEMLRRAENSSTRRGCYPAAPPALETPRQTNV
jgi:hypothetical protein